MKTSLINANIRRGLEASSAPTAQWGFFYYNDPQLFNCPDSRLDEMAAGFAARGISHVISFSVTHFRWSFYPYLEFINKMIGRYVRAFHNHGVKFIEHHSAIYLWNDEIQDCRPTVESRFAARESKMSNWPELRFDSRRPIGGVKIRDMLQISGLTGSPVFNRAYAGVAFCPNNPVFVRLYLAYLESLYRKGVDGIMTDDIAFIVDLNSCACDQCRSLYKTSTGFTLPPPGEEWAKWINSAGSPSLNAWKKFRFDSVRRFHEKVTAHYRSLGLDMIRPWYMATAMAFQGQTAYVFDEMPVMDLAFKENMYNAVIRYSWLDTMFEAAHRFAVGRSRGIPSAQMFYPEREDTLLFAWGMSLACGQLYLGTCHGSSRYPVAAEAELRRFEARNATALRAPMKIADIAFYDSIITRKLHADYNETSARALKFWAQCCALSNIPWDIIIEKELEGPLGYSMIVMPETLCVSDREARLFRDFIANGGTLAIIGHCAVRDENGVEANPNRLGAELANARPGDSFRVGKGQIIIPPEKYWRGPSFSYAFAERWTFNKQVSSVWLPPTREDRERFSELAGFIRAILPSPGVLSVEDCPRDLLITVFMTAAGNITTRLLNAGETLAPVTECPSHDDPIPFPDILADRPLTIRVRKPDRLNGVPFKSAILTGPSLPERSIPLVDETASISFTIPRGTRIDYAMVRCDVAY